MPLAINPISFEAPGIFDKCVITSFDGCLNVETYQEEKDTMDRVFEEMSMVSNFAFNYSNVGDLSESFGLVTFSVSSSRDDAIASNSVESLKRQSVKTQYMKFIWATYFNRRASLLTGGPEYDNGLEWHVVCAVGWWK